MSDKYASLTVRYKTAKLCNHIFLVCMCNCEFCFMVFQDLTQAKDNERSAVEEQMKQKIEDLNSLTQEMHILKTLQQETLQENTVLSGLKVIQFWNSYIHSCSSLQRWIQWYTVNTGTIQLSKDKRLPFCYRNEYKFCILIQKINIEIILNNPVKLWLSI